MKKCLFVLLGALFVCSAATAGYTYTETETITTWERISADIPCGCNKRSYSSRNVKPCEIRTTTSQPVRVKTHTEVIDHYQVYQPVTVYKPIRTELQRRIVR